MMSCCPRLSSTPAACAEEYGFVVAKDNTDLQGQLNDGLATVQEDGTYDELYEQYFPNAGN